MKNRYLIRRYDRTKNEFSEINLSYLTNDIEFCTGLKDKNGLLIFEGDIIKVTYLDGNESIYKIKWFGDEMGYPTFDIDSSTDFDDCHGLSYIFDSGEYDVEVIGNHWENSELLI